MVIMRNTAFTSFHNITACEVSLTTKEVLSLYKCNIKSDFPVWMFKSCRALQAFKVRKQSFLSYDVIKKQKTKQTWPPVMHKMPSTQPS